MTVRVIAYACASAQKAADARAEVDAQLAAVRSAIVERGWELAAEATDLEDGCTAAPSRRPGLGPALAALDDGAADGLAVTSLDRVTCSSLGWAEIVERSRAHDWTVLATAEGMDLRADSDRMLAEVARAERRLISSRAKAGAAAARAQGTRLGRPVEHSAEVHDLVVEARAAGATLQQIADRLTAEGLPTPRGGRWYRSTVRSILNSAELDAEAAWVRASRLGAGSQPVSGNARDPLTDDPRAACETSPRDIDSQPDLDVPAQFAAVSAQVRALTHEAAALRREVMRGPCVRADMESLVDEIRSLEVILAALVEFLESSSDRPDASTRNAGRYRIVEAETVRIVGGHRLNGAMNAKRSAQPESELEARSARK